MYSPIFHYFQFLFLGFPPGFQHGAQYLQNHRQADGAGRCNLPLGAGGYLGRSPLL